MPSGATILWKDLAKQLQADRDWRVGEINNISSFREKIEQILREISFVCSDFKYETSTEDLLLYF